MSVEIVTKEDLDAAEGRLMAAIVAATRDLRETFDRIQQAAEAKQAVPLVTSGYIPALEYMRAVGIKRWKFDQLIAENKVRAVKKKRKIYVPVGEVERYFKDPSIR